MDQAQKMLLDNKLLDLKDRLRELPNVKLTTSDYRQLALEEGWDMDTLVFYWLEHHRPLVSSMCDSIQAERARGLTTTFKQRAILADLIRRQARAELRAPKPCTWWPRSDHNATPTTNGASMDWRANRVDPTSVPPDAVSGGPAPAGSTPQPTTKRKTKVQP